MRLATIATSRGLRLHVKARSGYVDVADATGDPLLSSVGLLLEAGPPALDTIRGLLDRDGTSYDAADFGPAVPEPRRILCLGVNYAEHVVAEEGDRSDWRWRPGSQTPTGF